MTICSVCGKEYDGPDGYTWSSHDPVALGPYLSGKYSICIECILRAVGVQIPNLMGKKVRFTERSRWAGKVGEVVGTGGPGPRQTWDEIDVRFPDGQIEREDIRDIAIVYDPEPAAPEAVATLGKFVYIDGPSTYADHYGQVVEYDKSNDMCRVFIR